MQLYLKLALCNVRRDARLRGMDRRMLCRGVRGERCGRRARYRAAPADRAHDRPRRRTRGAAEGMIVGLCHSA